MAHNPHIETTAILFRKILAYWNILRYRTSLILVQPAMHAKAKKLWNNTNGPVCVKLATAYVMRVLQAGLSSVNSQKQQREAAAFVIYLLMVPECWAFLCRTKHLNARHISLLLAIMLLSRGESVSTPIFISRKQLMELSHTPSYHPGIRS